ncbi:hypothetical protein KM1_002690 [Entamoeba histolytica HM-3:IMSS]|uniref:Transmembrane protein n=1 Tax=Entamoeba histolytica HM-3:IMSS TaxID=885315 RepID=M7WH99_ENTHI|nr:hypothetical protein KM1_002690 [Entamoeba histolytica HM-3:IMSS]
MICYLLFMFTLLIFLFSCVSASIPLLLIDGKWTISGMKVQKETGNTIHRFEPMDIIAVSNENRMNITNENTSSKYYLFAINSTSFLFESDGPSFDSKYLEYPFIFSILPYNNIFFSSFQGWNHTWIDIVLTNQATTITLSAYTNTSITLLVATKNIDDERSFFKRYYLLFLVSFYLLAFIIPNYLASSCKK